ncbi:unnamed protein product [Blepharisma stoltei]|uniref:EamA domain-containing protein n=1 Tax=Blepharisma stoltei TaxID=1481888 RepID=A0AAU9K280_9CILI|nr:unnamed protein product [Blepharisma stoltei]
MEERALIYSFMGSYLIFGAGSTIILKSMDESDYIHPYFQCATLFLGELTCLAIYYLIKFHKNTQSRKNSYKVLQTNDPDSPRTGAYKKYGLFLFAIPAFFYWIAASLMFLGLILSAASVYQMVRGIISIFVTAYSVLILKVTLFKHQIVGICFLLLGIILVSISSLVWTALSAKYPLIGIILLICGQFFAAGVLLCEEIYLKQLDVEPLQAIGLEGAFGVGFSLIFIPILYFIPCNYENLCSHGSLENGYYAFTELWDTKLLLFWLGSLFSFAIVYFTGISTTKYTNALARSTIDTCKTLFVWIFSMVSEWEEFVILQCVGFLCIVFGTAIYNEILVIPWFGLKQSVEARRNTRNTANRSSSTSKVSSIEKEKKEQSDL